MRERRAGRRPPGSPRSPRPGRARCAARSPASPSRVAARRHPRRCRVPRRDQRSGDGRPAERVVVRARHVERAGRRSTGRARAAARPSARTARGGGRAAPASVASNASSSGSIPKPRIWSSPSHSPRSRVTIALISTPGTSVTPAGTASAAHDLAIAGQRVVVGQGQEPDADLGRRGDQRRPARRRRPSASCGCAGRSSTGPAARPGRPAGANGSWRRRRGAAVTSGLDEPLDPLDGEGAPGRRVDVDLDGVEDDRSPPRPRTGSAGR